MAINLDLFEPFERLLRIKVRGREAEVPENNTLLRGFHYLFGDAVCTGRFCWNNECGNCVVTFRSPGAEAPRRVRSCQVIAEAGMEVLVLSPDLALFAKD